MRKIQELFNLLIDAGYYTDTNTGCRYMCIAARRARNHGDISNEEYLKISTNIHNYLGIYSSLGAHLISLNRPYDYEDRLEIYKNWAKRPKTKLKY